MTQEQFEETFYGILSGDLESMRTIYWNEKTIAVVASIVTRMTGKLVNYATCLDWKLKDFDMIVDKANNTIKVKDSYKKICKKYNNILDKNTINKFRKFFKENECPLIEFVKDNFIFIIAYTEDIDQDNPVTFVFSTSRDVMIGCSTLTLPAWAENCIVSVVKKENPEQKYYKYVAHGPNGFDTMFFEVENMHVNVEDTYNDNLPDEQIRAFLGSKSHGIVIFHGEPGTGKSTYIRHLIEKVDNVEFLYMDQSCFNQMTNASFLRLLYENRNAVLIVEDAEKLIESRNNKSLSFTNISSILNLSDGLLSDCLKMKIICTFNAPLEDIDKALLRKGRLKIKYKFDKLSKNKVKNLSDKLGKNIKKPEDMTLAEIFHYDEKVDYSDKKKKNIGFNILEENYIDPNEIYEPVEKTDTTKYRQSPSLRACEGQCDG